MVGGVKTTILLSSGPQAPGLPSGHVRHGLHPVARAHDMRRPRARQNASLTHRRKSRPRGYNPFVQLGEYRSTTPAASGCGAPPILQSTQRALSPIRTATAWHCLITSATAVASTSRTRPPRQHPVQQRQPLPPRRRNRLVGPYLDNCGFFSLEGAAAARASRRHDGERGISTPSPGEGMEQVRPDPQANLIARPTCSALQPAAQNTMRLTGEMMRQLPDHPLLRLPEPHRQHTRTSPKSRVEPLGTWSSIFHFHVVGQRLTLIFYQRGRECLSPCAAMWQA